VVLGEVALDYIQNDFSWEGDNPQAVIRAARERAKQIYGNLRKELSPHPQPAIA
jgi:hypothetical protein